MKDILIQMFKRTPKKVLAVAVLTVASLGVASAVTAWFPERPTYTIENPAPHVTFNSITNNPNYGDERTFFDVKDAANTNQGGFVDKITDAKDGQVLLMRVYVHNNAADELNGTNFNGPGVAKNTKVRIHLPTANASALRANAYVSADNAQPKEVADTIDVGSNGNFSLSYVPGSAVQYTNAVPSGIKLSDSIVTNGAPIGYTKADGKVPGCFEFTSIVTIKVKVSKPSYNVQKSVRFEGQTSNDWKESVTAKPGQTVEWRVAFTNTGSTTLNDVTVLDQVPEGLTVVPGSVKVFNANNPNGHTYGSEAVQANGRQVNVNIGAYNPTANAFVLFKTKVPAEKDLECGVNKFHNVAYATPKGSGTVNDDADVKVERKCKPEKPVFDCDAVTVAKLDGRKIRVSVDTTAANGATVKSYTYDFGDGSTPLVTDKNPVEYTYAKDGNYIVRVKVTFQVGDKTEVVESDNCADQVSFETPVTPGEVLPVTGAGEVFGIFTAVTIAGAVWHRLFWSRRFN